LSRHWYHGTVTKPRTSLRVSDWPRSGDRAGLRAAVGLAVGIAVGIATSFAQTGLSGVWQALANAASPWLAGAFVAGLLQRKWRWSVVAGLGCCLFEVLSYYAMTAARGFPESTKEIVFWSVAAVIGGPVFGWAGHAWRCNRSRLRTLGGACLPSTFLGEALGTYGIRLGYWDDVLLYGLIGAGLLCLLARTSRHLVFLIGATVVATGIGLLLYGPLLGFFDGATFGG